MVVEEEVDKTQVLAQWHGPLVRVVKAAMLMETRRGMFCSDVASRRPVLSKIDRKS